MNYHIMFTDREGNILRETSLEVANLTELIDYVHEHVHKVDLDPSEVHMVTADVDDDIPHNWGG